MNDNNQSEKLNINPDKVIHILLKHIMLLKNENMYLQNKISLSADEKPLPEVKDGSSTTEYPLSEAKDGSSFSEPHLSEMQDGSSFSEFPLSELKGGSSFSEHQLTEPKGGSFYSVNALLEMPDAQKGEDGLCSVLELGLCQALEQYGKNTSPKNSLYYYYSDFVKAVSQKNSEFSALREGITQVKTDEAKPEEPNVTEQLEDTHFMPAQLTVDTASINKMHTALRGILPRTATMDMYKTVARELLLLHNAGHATSTQLRQCSGLSVGGFNKHLPNMQRYNLIKQQPARNYILTQLSKHILLKAFGILKNTELTTNN